MHDAFEQFGAFTQDAVDNKALLAKGGKLTMPVLAIGAEKSFGAGQADVMRFVATNVDRGIVPDSGHWIMEENPQATVKTGHGVSCQMRSLTSGLADTLQVGENDNSGTKQRTVPDDR